MPSNARLYDTYAYDVAQAPRSAGSSVSEKRELWKAITIEGPSALALDGVGQTPRRSETAEIKSVPKTFSWVPAGLPRIESRKTHVTLAEWEGYVDRVVDGVVFARLRDVRRPRTIETELAEIPIEEFSFSDRVRLEPGAIFRWAIGISNEGKTQSRYSQLVVRDLPLWTKRDVLEAEQDGAQLSARLRAKIDDGPITRSD